MNTNGDDYLFLLFASLGCWHDISPHTDLLALTLCLVVTLGLLAQVDGLQGTDHGRISRHGGFKFQVR